MKRKKTDSRMEEMPAVFSQSEKFSELMWLLPGKEVKSLGEEMEDFSGPKYTREARSTGESEGSFCLGK